MSLSHTGRKDIRQELGSSSAPSVERIKPGASHYKTNNIMYDLITKHLGKESNVLDFGAGRGHMSQRIGDYFAGIGAVPREHIHACEICPEDFQYSEIDCLHIMPDSSIPFDDNTFDVIYAIEVLEHMARPYDFLSEAHGKLRNGGQLIFSTPNILHFKSRLKFLMTGYGEMFGPLSADPVNAGRICGHIMPLNYSHYHYGLRKAGFSQIDFHIDRRKMGALIPTLFFYPVLKLFSYVMEKSTIKYDNNIWLENRDVIALMNSLDMLSARSCIIVAVK